MNKKKNKRVDARAALEGEQAAKRAAFYESGAAASLCMLALFALAASIVLTLDAQMIRGLWDRQWSALRPLLLVCGIMLLLSAALGLYVGAYQCRAVKNHVRGAVLLAALLVMVAVIRTGVVNNLSPYLVIVPLLVMAIMMTVAYSQRFALGISGFLLIISAIALHPHQAMYLHAVPVLLMGGSGVGVAILRLREIRTRSKLIEVSAAAASVVFVMIWLTGLWEQRQTNEILANSLWAAAGALAVGFLMQGLLPFIEKLFRTATNLTLLDYSEATKPLLRRLAVEAPGTFNHSLQIGMLAEAAAETVNANGLLCRVGSYYHDVGKLSKPRYFVENQGERLSQHKELSPTMSRMIIIGHVKDGIELARQYKLPRVLHQFIETHHGTTLVEYFYHEATKKEAEEGRTVTETEFRYPGPRPQTKESAIVMLTDAVESATRAMQDPTPSRIEDIVNSIAMRRLQDRQFDQCDLTMRELRLIANSLVKSLCGMYHGRIAYPKQEKKREKIRSEQFLLSD